MVKVSVCIPAYNQPELFKQAVESVLMQSYSDYEIVITDDSTGEDVKEAALTFKDNRIRYFKNEKSLGTPQNWNCAAEKAEGELIKFLHHDDFFTSKDSLKKYVNMLNESPDASFGFSASQVWELSRSLKRIHSCSPKQLERLKKQPEYLFFGNRIGAPSAVIYRKNVNVEFDKNFKWLVDIDFYISLLKKNNKAVYIGEPLVCTMDGAAGQVTQSVLKDKEIQVREHVELFDKLLIPASQKKSFISYFDDLFVTFGIASIDELVKICTVPEKSLDFFNEVFEQLPNNRLMKKSKKRFYTSRYNKKFFKLERY